MKQVSFQLAFCASVPLAISALCGFTASRSWWWVLADCGIDVRSKPRSGTDIGSPCSPLPCPMPMPGLAPSPFSSLSVKCLHESFCGGRVQVAQVLSQLAGPPWTTTWKPCRARHVAHFLRTNTPANRVPSGQGPLLLGAFFLWSPLRLPRQRVSFPPPFTFTNFAPTPWRSLFAIHNPAIPTLSPDPTKSCFSGHYHDCDSLRFRPLSRAPASLPPRAFLAGRKPSVFGSRLI